MDLKNSLDKVIWKGELNELSYIGSFKWLIKIIKNEVQSEVNLME